VSEISWVRFRAEELVTWRVLLWVDHEQRAGAMKSGDLPKIA
jgi:hypothetical protein